jgi:hypothetical protein
MGMGMGMEVEVEVEVEVCGQERPEAIWSLQKDEESCRHWIHQAVLDRVFACCCLSGFTTSHSQTRYSHDRSRKSNLQTMHSGKI